MSVPTIILDVGLMAMLVVVAFSIVKLRSLFAIVMLQGVYSLLCAAWFVSLDAVDVAFTEAAVGAGISTVLMLAAMLLVDRHSSPIRVKGQWGALIVVIMTGLAMLYAVADMPAYGDAHSPANSYVGADYLAKTAKEIHIPNVVTAVLASYRGFDTFGEVVVVFAAGIGVLLLLGLNGNAGHWEAKPNGVRLSPSAPSAVRSAQSVKTPPKPASKPAPKPTRKSKPVQKVRAAKKPTAKKASVQAKAKAKTGGAVKKSPARKKRPQTKGARHE